MQCVAIERSGSGGNERNKQTSEQKLRNFEEGSQGVRQGWSVGGRKKSGLRGAAADSSRNGAPSIQGVSEKTTSPRFALEG